MVLGLGMRALSLSARGMVFVSLAAATSVLSVSIATLQAAHAQEAGQSAVSYSIPAGPLGDALTAFGRQSGLQVTFLSDVATGKTSPGYSGTGSREQALNAILAGSGLSYSFPNATTVAISAPLEDAGATLDGAIALDTINVSGAAVDASSVYTPYETAAPTAFISQETIERFRGSSPADIFRGTPGVMSGEARNGGGSIDVNIRGMQGMGRVAVKIDGAENGLTVYQGYQGISNRSYVDPDLLAGVDITKGSDAASRGIAGTVEMRTLSADDVVRPGEKWGGWVKTGFGTNTATPQPGDLGGYSWPVSYYSNSAAPSSTTTGLHRPGPLDPTSGSLNVVTAAKDENVDLLWGYAFRKQGNYFAGKNGPGAGVTDNGPGPLCYSSGTCYYPPHPISYDHTWTNTGLTSYRAGEQVLNTQLTTESWIAKATIRPDDDQSLQLGYTSYRSNAGDVVASLFSSVQSQAEQQTQEDSTELGTGTLRYRWDPSDNDLIDFKANLWMTKLRLRTPPRVSYYSTRPEDFGLPYNYMPGNDSKMWGGDLTNTSGLSLDQLGSIEFTYGLSYINESTEPLPFSNELNLNIPSRDGAREEAGGFGKAAYKPFDWLTLNAGLRYSHYWSEDRSEDSTSAIYINPERSRDEGGYSPSAGVVVEPVKGTQVYANYSSALHMPTIFEAVAGYTLVPNPDIAPERSNNWELGVNVIKDGLFEARDSAMVKFGYFNWDVDDYVARISRTFVNPTTGGTSTALQVTNIDRAMFEGMEFSGRYENNGFTADLTANYYLNVEFCPTAATCDGSTLSGDYATNQVPPQYSANLTVSQKLLADALTVGGRASYTGPRAVGHGEVQYGAAALIAPIEWQPYWLFDVFTEYKLSEDVTLWGTVENVTDQYYVDPLSLVQQPGPGRTVRIGMTSRLGGNDPITSASIASLFSPGEGLPDWSGFYAGATGAYNFAELGGTTTALDGTTGGYSALESPNLKVGALSFGLQAGYDVQLGSNVVAGIVGDITKSEISASQVTYATEGSTGPYTNNLNRGRQFEAVQTTDIEWLSTIRGRLGYAFNDKLMVYATGGLAFMRQQEQRTQYALQQGSNSSTVAAFTESASRTRTGYVIGGGAEYALGEGWSLEGEYLLAKFHDDDAFTFSDARAGVMRTNNFGYPTTFDTVTGRKVNSKVDIPMLKVGVKYRF